MIGLLLSATILSACNSSSEDQEPSETEISTVPKTSFIEFIADPEILLEEASNAGVKMDEDEVLHLVYQDNESKTDRITTSTETSNWLEFERGTAIKDRSDFYVVELPDGTYRTYGYNPTIGLEGDNTCLTSKFSTDGVNFEQEEGCRYELVEDDKGSMGVWDVFTTENGEVVLLYIGDKEGENSVRKAVSTDNGWTFTFVTDNVLGSETFGADSFVDQRSIRMQDGRILLVAMRQGEVYEFISKDDGETFELYEEPILTKDSYPDLAVIGLHDPQLVELPDGRYRIYVTISLEGGTPGQGNPPSILVSATSN